MVVPPPAPFYGAPVVAKYGPSALKHFGALAGQAMTYGIGLYKASRYERKSEMANAYKKPRYARNTTRRKYRRRYRRGRIRIHRRIPTHPPRQQLVKMKMSWTGGLTGATGAIGVHTVKANSLNDPTGSVTAQLPLYLDQYAAFYNKYCVVASKLIILGHSSSTSAGAALYGINLVKDSTTLADVGAYREAPYSAVKMLTADMDHSGLAMTYKGKMYEKVRDWKDSEDYHGTFSVTPGDPTTVRYYHIFIDDLTGSESVALEYLATLEFTILLFDPIVPTRSSL